MPRLLLALLLALTLSPALADQRSETQQQLEQTRQDIDELKKLQEQLDKERSSVQQQLRKTESEMGELEKQIRSLQDEMGTREKEIQRLDQEKKKLQSSRLEQQRLIAIQARAAYQSGRQEYLKLLLNQEQPEKLSRTLTYYGYLGSARVKQLDAFNTTLRQLAEVESSISGQQSQLTEQRSALDQRRSELAAVREERAQVLTKLNRDYASSESKLELRQAEQAELGRVLKRIEEEIARRAREEEEARQRALAEERRLREQLERQQREQERALASAPRQKTPKPQPLTLVSSGAGYGGPFAEARGRLPWPISGRLIARYGSPRGEDNRATWDGVLISASAGSPVRAIHDGRVVFADWLRGSGLLVILDHGNGYLSLYGHNQSLLKNAGDIVKAGEPIATVGTSGGQETPALYFAIRQQGRPTDPAQWCRAQG